ncbi:MAG: hypothetical protein R3E13_07630 [Alphaproteobacteria bacterium]
MALSISESHAQESKFCGTPAPAALDTKAEAHCDIYQRQLAYREKALKMDTLMKERQENFAAPRREAIKRYEADMEALNATRSSDNF